MRSDRTHTPQLKALEGKTIAVVYIFEGEQAAGFEHYWIWKSDIISAWLRAIQELKCIPFILDVRTFVQKAIHNSLPCIDFVINLNCGSCELNSMSLIPSVCSFIGLPCIPCDAASIVMGENKIISNHLAKITNLNVPNPITQDKQEGIFRPRNLGSSIGVKRCYSDDIVACGVFQEFIPGYDVTIPLAYNPCVHELDILPPILYFPLSKDPYWFYDEEEKKKDNGFQILPLLLINDDIKKEILRFASLFPINTYGRIDARIKCLDAELSTEISRKPISYEDLYFIEINPMPTVEKDDSFEFAYLAAKVDLKHSFYPYISLYSNSIRNPTINGFLLSCAMLSLSRAKY